jgi:hypothetical protein
MKAPRLKMGVAPQHLPVLMTVYKRDLLYREFCLEKPASHFVPQRVKVKVLNL